MSAAQNVVGPEIRRIRFQKGWTQGVLAARCSRAGWDISENTIAKIEARIRCVTDTEIVRLARALGVQLEDVFPANLRKK
jgi:transcriptional regulator with XRE-family HTH domain